MYHGGVCWCWVMLLQSQQDWTCAKQINPNLWKHSLSQRFSGGSSRGYDHSCYKYVASAFCAALKNCRFNLEKSPKLVSFNFRRSVSRESRGIVDKIERNSANGVLRLCSQHLLDKKDCLQLFNFFRHICQHFSSTFVKFSARSYNMLQPQSRKRWWHGTRRNEVLHYRIQQGNPHTPERGPRRFSPP